MERYTIKEHTLLKVTNITVETSRQALRSFLAREILDMSINIAYNMYKMKLQPRNSASVRCLLPAASYLTGMPPSGPNLHHSLQTNKSRGNEEKNYVDNPT